MPAPDVNTQGSEGARSISPSERTRYKAGHPRFNVVVLLVLLTILLAIALVQAQRLAIP